MLALYKKELLGFFSSLSGYIVIILFTTLNGLFLWLFPGEMNILEGGYASLSPLFLIAPWMFLLLIPAVTMRMISDEKKSGTLDLLFTQPKTEFEIVLAKFLASLTLASIAILLTLSYFYTVGLLGSPQFNLDVGGITGSYLGLFFLAACYSSIGILASAITENTIVSFLLAVLLCFFAYSGFDYASRLFDSGNAGAIVLQLGIDAHYQSISRGVIDSRDLVYFLSLITVFLSLAGLKLKSRLWN